MGGGLGEWWSCSTWLWSSGWGPLELWGGCFVAEALEEDLSRRRLQAGREVWEGIEGGERRGRDRGRNKRRSKDRERECVCRMKERGEN